MIVKFINKSSDELVTVSNVYRLNAGKNPLGRNVWQLVINIPDAADGEPWLDYKELPRKDFDLWRADDELFDIELKRRSIV
jgi:hypothetical protein